MSVPDHVDGPVSAASSGSPAARQDRPGGARHRARRRGGTARRGLARLRGPANGAPRARRRLRDPAGEAARAIRRGPRLRGRVELHRRHPVVGTRRHPVAARRRDLGAGRRWIPAPGVRTPLPTTPRSSWRNSARHCASSRPASSSSDGRAGRVVGDRGRVAWEFECIVLDSSPRLLRARHSPAMAANRCWSALTMATEDEELGNLVDTLEAARSRSTTCVPSWDRAASRSPPPPSRPCAQPTPLHWPSSTPRPTSPGRPPSDLHGPARAGLPRPRRPSQPLAPRRWPTTPRSSATSRRPLQGGC